MQNRTLACSRLRPGGAGGGLAEAEFRGIFVDIVTTELGPGEAHATMTTMVSGALLVSVGGSMPVPKGAGAEVIEAFDLLLAAVR